MDFSSHHSHPAFDLCYQIARAASSLSCVATAYLVGGCVRDAILQTAVPKDFDLELYGILEDEVEPFLKSIGPDIAVLRVGRSFPVWKVWNSQMSQGDAVDVALPRREAKTGLNHTDFQVILDPAMPFYEAALRRDFSFNAMGFDPLHNEIIDLFHGRQDLADHILRHVSSRFVEDPLRVMRGAQFCARFNLRAAPETIDLCRTLAPDHLSAERLWEEWCKMILKGQKISAGIRFLIDTGWIQFFPELAALQDVPQDPDHHPEGTALVHTMHCLNAFAAARTGDDHEDLIVGFAVLCHDFGKATHTTIDENGKIHSYGHEEAGEEPARRFLSRLTNQEDFINNVVALVVNHMKPTFLYQEATRGGTVKMMNRSLRRLAREVHLDRLARVVWCDKAGRPPKPQVSPEADWLKSRAGEINVLKEAPKPILQGRHLIQMGVKPGVEMGKILHESMELQLDGMITDLEAALAWAEIRLTSVPNQS